MRQSKQDSVYQGQSAGAISDLTAALVLWYLESSRFTSLPVYLHRNGSCAECRFGPCCTVTQPNPVTASEVGRVFLPCVAYCSSLFPHQLLADKLVCVFLQVTSRSCLSPGTPAGTPWRC